jgi:hypothetical protein
MTTWNYRRVIIQVDAGDWVTDFEGGAEGEAGYKQGWAMTLFMLGQEGWELVSMVPLPSGGAIHAVFKKPG